MPWDEVPRGRLEPTRPRENYCAGPRRGKFNLAIAIQIVNGVVARDCGQKADTLWLRNFAAATRKSLASKSLLSQDLVVFIEAIRKMRQILASLFSSAKFPPDLRPCGR